MRRGISESFRFWRLVYERMALMVRSVAMVDHVEYKSRTSWGTALWRGLRRRCPSCGQGAIFSGYVRVQGHCADCGLNFATYRSDDAPAYFTIVIVGHVIVPAMLILEQTAHPAAWVHMAAWLPLTLGLTLALLPRVKGALLGVQWMLGVKS